MNWKGINKVKLTLHDLARWTGGEILQGDPNTMFHHFNFENSFLLFKEKETGMNLFPMLFAAAPQEPWLVDQ